MFATSDNHLRLTFEAAKKMYEIWENPLYENFMYPDPNDRDQRIYECTKIVYPDELIERFGLEAVEDLRRGLIYTAKNMYANKDSVAPPHEEHLYNANDNHSQ